MSKQVSTERHKGMWLLSKSLVVSNYNIARIKPAPPSAVHGSSHSCGNGLLSVTPGISQRLSKANQHVHKHLTHGSTPLLIHISTIANNVLKLEYGTGRPLSCPVYSDCLTALCMVSTLHKLCFCKVNHLKTHGESLLRRLGQGKPKGA